ncbi:MAG: tRNA guanosine(34) transglycosylase Tgt [Planctomycetota bacterium]
MAPGFSFELTAGDARGPRAGRLTTPHGVVSTPAFMPVGTQGTVKGLTPEQLRGTGASILLANAYHLALRPGAETVRALGGLHRFMAWDGPILTDSGGFQVHSLAELRAIDDSGVRFRSHIDGSELFLTPERSLEIQGLLGTDIAMVLDHCPPGDAPRALAEEALERTLKWARRSAEHRDTLRTDSPMAVFGILQGGSHEDLRREGAERIAEIPFDGYAIGGVSVGEDRQRLLESIPWGTRGLPVARPRYLMGVAGFEEFTHAIAAGVDLFDCVLPTRNARNGTLFRRRGEPLRIRNERHRADGRPIEEGCDCAACRGFSRGFLHHLFLRRELLGYTLASLHNLRVFHRFLEEARRAITAGRWEGFSRAWLGA